jgi:hypothetical protein
MNSNQSLAAALGDGIYQRSTAATRPSEPRDLSGRLSVDDAPVTASPGYAVLGANPRLAGESEVAALSA